MTASAWQTHRIINRMKRIFRFSRIVILNRGVTSSFEGWWSTRPLWEEVSTGTSPCASASPSTLNPPQHPGSALHNPLHQFQEHGRSERRNWAENYSSCPPAAPVSTIPVLCGSATGVWVDGQRGTELHFFSPAPLMLLELMGEAVGNGIWEWPCLSS